MDPFNEDIEEAVSQAVDDVAEHSPASPSVQPAVVLEIAELKFRKITDDEDWTWEEIRTLLAREVERQS